MADFRRNENTSAKRVWFITDTHLGIRNNSNEWLDQTREYFKEFFFPTVKSNYHPGDVLIHLGDYFDSRQSINLKVLNLGIEIAEEISQIFLDGSYIIIGNHDIWNKSSNDINSVKSLKWIPKINIFEEPESVQLGPRKFLMLPWMKDHESENGFLNSCDPHDILCCHTDVSGAKFNKYTTVQEGPSLNSFAKFRKVYSGHIHFSQKIGNVNMLGSPYELTRSDMDNIKSITLLDLESLEEKIFINDFSPKFKRFNFSDILEMTPDELEIPFRNNFVDILIDPAMAIKAPLSILTDIVTSQRSLKFHPINSDTPSMTQQFLDSEGKSFNVLDFISDYIDSLDHDHETKIKLKSSLTKIHQYVTTQDQDQKVK
jgi:DNA repair exonuclease SbcCD nuclease subunit